MKNYEGNIAIWVEDLEGYILQSKDAIIPDWGWWTFRASDAWEKFFSNEVIIKKKGEYLLKVSEFVDDNISWSVAFKVLAEDSWLKELMSYSQEYIDAYNWAYERGITTQSLDKANLLWPITRQAMAKMIVIFSENVLNKAWDVTLWCDFIDFDIADDLKSYVKKSCQMGIMWQWVSNFNPSWTLSRAQFWTILSRVLWWNAYEWGTPYYQKHLEKLKSSGIMSKIENAETKEEQRWNVMIMLKRAEKLFE